MVNGFFTSDGSPARDGTILALLPSGTGCDFRRSVGLSSDPARLAAVLAANHTRGIDLGHIAYDEVTVPARHFINIADCGVGGEVVARLNRGGSKGAEIALGALAGTMTVTFGGPRSDWRIGKCVTRSRPPTGDGPTGPHGDSLDHSSTEVGDHRRASPP